MKSPSFLDTFTVRPWWNCYCIWKSNSSEPSSITCIFLSHFNLQLYYIFINLLTGCEKVWITHLSAMYHTHSCIHTIIKVHKSPQHTHCNTLSCWGILVNSYHTLLYIFFTIESLCTKLDFRIRIFSKIHRGLKDHLSMILLPC